MDELIGKQIVGVVNFPSKQIGPIKSQFLLTGFVRSDGAVVLAQPEREVQTAQNSHEHMTIAIQF